MSKTQYSSLFTLAKDQPKKSAFAYFPYDISNRENWETPFEILAKKAKKEIWDYGRPEFKKEGRQYPILTNYLNYTFLRLQDEGKIAISKDGNQTCLNTGLQTQQDQDIFALFEKNRMQDDNTQDWYFKGWYNSYEHEISQFSPPPDIAMYIQDVKDLIFNTAYAIEINLDHILGEKDNLNKLPIQLRENLTLAKTTLNGASNILKRKIRRNYKMAIPSWYVKHKKIQLLLPLYVTSEVDADVALLAEGDHENKHYRIPTILSMDIAYCNARLITRPDREWLNP